MQKGPSLCSAKFPLSPFFSQFPLIDFPFFISRWGKDSKSGISRIQVAYASNPVTPSATICADPFRETSKRLVSKWVLYNFSFDLLVTCSLIFDFFFLHFRWVSISRIAVATVTTPDSGNPNDFAVGKGNMYLANLPLTYIFFFTQQLQM